MTEVIDGIEARKRAQEIRERWLASVVSGEVGLDELLVFARGSERDSTYVSSIRLVTLLEALPGWSNAAALSVLQQNGFKQNDTIKTLRSANLKAERFRYVFELPPPSFASTRPEMPAGWPWEGKLSLLVKITGQDIPALQMDGYGDSDSSVMAERLKKPASPQQHVNEVRANPATGEVVESPVFWRSESTDSAESLPIIDENDLEAIFGADDEVSDDDIASLLQ